MNKEEKESVAHLEWFLDEGILTSEDEPYIETILNLIQKQEKIIEAYEEMITKHKEQLKQSGIYGYDYDLKIMEKEVEKE